MEGLYRGRVSKPLSADALSFVSSLEEDEEILLDDILGTLAHVVSLSEEGIITREERAKICRALLEILEEARAGRLKPEGPFEDVHEFLEGKVIERVGSEVGGKMHTGRSRNDQVALDIRLYCRRSVIEICRELLLLERELLKVAEANVETLVPLYTHTQQAQIGTLGHYFLSKFDELMEDLERILCAYRRLNLSPLGACAIGGSTLPLNRERVAELLGFEGIVENSVQAVSSRSFLLELASVFSILMNDLSRMAEDLVLWSSEEFGFVRISEEYASTSSVMPQKVNPCTLELVRARASEVEGLTSGLFSILKGLITGYNRDLQQTKPLIFRILQTTRATLRVMRGVISTLEIREARCREVVERSYAVALDLAESLVSEHGVPFRLAHRIVGGVVRRAVESGRRLAEISEEEIEEEAKKVGIKLELPPGFVKTRADPLASIHRRRSKGSPNPQETRAMLRKRKEKLQEMEGELARIEGKINAAIDNLLKVAKLE